MTGAGIGGLTAVAGLGADLAKYANPDLPAAFTQSRLDGYRLDELTGGTGSFDGGR
ncbi:hypothetical protein [Streptomyces coeruleorubidus]|uniref:hypothetical protein n=1 Tax=Streptomyces coeruleorubidus TaxID=116188 RepID=UPI00142F1F0A|nr:hypothetical protein [Streptomyces coeruleorubidus]